MKPFLYRLGAAILLALGGLICGYVLVAPQRNDLQKQLSQAQDTCDKATEQMTARIKDHESKIALQNAVLMLYRTQRDLRQANFGLALTRVEQAKGALEKARSDAEPATQKTIDSAVTALDELKTTVANQDGGATAALDEIIKGLEPT